MPMIIDHIDAIARKKKRGVLFLEFHSQNSHPHHLSVNRNYDYETNPVRQCVISWLKQMKIKHYPCAEFADENAMMAYLGQLYIDLPFDESNVIYRCLDRYLVKPDGCPRFKSVRFCYLPLSLAMKNKAHDDPGYWNHWAKRF